MDFRVRVIYQDPRNLNVHRRFVVSNTLLVCYSGSFVVSRDLPRGDDYTNLKVGLNAQ